MPYYADGGRRRGQQGSTADVAALQDFVPTREAAARTGMTGIGFAPLPQFGIVALDFDNCIDSDGHLPPEIQEIVSLTYAEYSPSGKGVRAFFRGNVGNHKSPTTPSQYGFETFSTTGFVTVTGNMLPGTELLGLENTVADVPDVVRVLCDRRFGKSTPDPADDETDPLATLKLKIGLSYESMLKLLERLDPDMGRDEWIRVGMALHHECDGDDTGFELWNDWSAGGGKYPSYDAVRAQWDSFDRPRSRTRWDHQHGHRAQDGEGP